MFKGRFGETEMRMSVGEFAGIELILKTIVDIRKSYLFISHLTITD